MVLEAGWSESQAQLERDSQLWLEGSAEAVKVVLLFKLYPANINKEIKATLNVCRVVDNTIVRKTFVYSFFPYPSLSLLDPTNQPPYRAENLPPPL